MGESKSIQSLKQQLRQAAASKNPVRIRGELGSGCLLAACVLHEINRRSETPLLFLPADLTPPNDIISELTGSIVRGFGSNLYQHRLGLFAAARGGTLIIRGWSEMPPKAQKILKKFMKSGYFRPFGSEKNDESDARLIFIETTFLESQRAKAINSDFAVMIEIFPTIEISPLRDRKGDISILFWHFLAKFAADHALNQPKPTSKLMEALEHFTWPGNVTELINVAERLVVLHPGERVGAEGLPDYSTMWPKLSNNETSLGSLLQL